MHPACNAHEPYCQLCANLLYYIFPYYLTLFEKKYINTKCVLILYTTSKSYVYRTVHHCDS